MCYFIALGNVNVFIAFFGTLPIFLYLGPPPLHCLPLPSTYLFSSPPIFPLPPPLPGVLVQGLARLRYGALTPLYEAKVGEESREVAVHRHYVGDSLSLFLLYFLQLAVMATYISQDLLKLVPLLTIVFAFGR